MNEERFPRETNIKSAYQRIAEFYGDEIAERSGVRKMNHIDEGLLILDTLRAKGRVKDAYCLHPMFQDDNYLRRSFRFASDIDSRTILLVMEYRSVANDYLSTKELSVDQIRLSPLTEVNLMLIADKVQNRKDFELYHEGKHERSKELAQYFRNWLERLGVSEEEYNCLKSLISRKSAAPTL